MGRPVDILPSPANLSSGGAEVLDGEPYTVVTDETALALVVEQLGGAATLAVDLETTGLDVVKEEIVGIALSGQSGTACYVPVRHRAGVQLPVDLVTMVLRPLLEAPDRTLVFHNAKFDTRFLAAAGYVLDPERIEDTLLEVFCAGTEYEHFGLKSLVQTIFCHRMTEFSELFPERHRGPKDISLVSYDDAGPYACEDADYCLRLHERYYAAVKDTFVYRLERSLWPIVQRLEETGAAVDRPLLRAMAAYVTGAAGQVAASIYDAVEAACGERVEFNLGSPQALAGVLFDRLHLPTTIKTKAGAASTSEMALERLARESPLCANILTHRAMLTNARMLTKIADEHVGPDGRVHTSYHQTGATTGRFSSADPNLQNVAKQKTWEVAGPDGTTETVSIRPRQAFVAAPGRYLIELDFAAIEYILLAALAGDTEIVEVYNRGGDVHRLTASQVLRKPLEEVTKDERDRAKTWNYLILYGGGGHALARRTGQDEAEAAADIKRFFEMRPKLATWVASVQAESRRTHQAVTWFGRVQHIPEYLSPDRSLRSKAERSAINRRVQGLAADFQKIGLLRTAALAQTRWPDGAARLVLQTHDSQTWEVEQALSPDEAIPLLIDAMSPDYTAYGLPRVRVEAKIGLDWGDLHLHRPGQDYAALWAERAVARAELRVSLGADDLGTGPAGAVAAIAAEANGPAPAPAANGATPADRTAVRLLIELAAEPSEADAAWLLDVLASFPGEHVVAVRYPGLVDDVLLRQRPTSLNERTAPVVLAPRFPAVRATTDRATLKAALAASFGTGQA